MSDKHETFIDRKEPLPGYYTNKHGQNIDDFIGDMNLRKGNAMKYIYRAGNKPGEPESKALRKAMNCIQLQINSLEKEGK